MTPIKKALASSAAVIALMSSPLMAQDTSTNADTGAAATSTLGDGAIGASTDTTATTNGDSANVDTTAQADTDSSSDPMKPAADADVAATDGTMNNSGDASSSTADATGTTMDSGTAATGEAATDTADATGTAMDSGTAATGEATTDMAGAPMTAGTLIGTNVSSSTGEDIGEIDDVVRVNGEMMAIVGIGGFLGLGEHDVALPLSELDWQGETVTAFGYSKEQLEGMAEYEPDAAEPLEADEPITLGKS